MKLTWSCERVRRTAAWAGGLSLLLPLAAPVLADSVNSAGIETKDVKIMKVEGDELYYTTSTGRDTHRPISDKLRISVLDEASLNTAEDAYGAGKWADAADAYQKTLRSTSKPWLKLYATPRLLKSAEKSGRFDLAVGAWLALVDQDPKAAADKKPSLPADPKSAFVQNAASQVEAMGSSSKDASKATMLLAYALELYRAAGNDKKVTEIATSLGRAAATNTGSAPEALSAVAASKLSLAGVDLDKKDYKAALAKLTDIREVVSEPALQSDWLWINAEAQAGELGEGKDATALRSLALEYMRVVAHFPGGKHTADALLRTAAIYEKLGDAPGAMNLYSQVARDFSDRPAGAEAKKSVQRLKGAPPTAG